MHTTLQPTAAPTRKVAYGLTLGTPFAIALVWVTRQFGIEMSAEVAAAFGAIMGQATSYFTKERR